MAAGDLALSLTISAVDAASNIINNIGKTLGNLAGGGAMGSVITGAIAAGSAIIGIGTSAAIAAGNFQQSMEQLVTSAGESQDNIKKLSDSVLQMSVDTGTSTQQLTSALYYLESSGLHAQSGLAALGVAAEGAKSENADLMTVAQALTTVLNDYNMKTTDAASTTASSTAVMNGLITTVQNGRTNLQQLSSSMGAILPTASALGISFAQVAGTLDTMTNAGVPAQQAAQNLAHVLLAFSAPSKAAISAMQGVGLSAQQVKDALVRGGLPEALQLIEDHIGKKFPADSYQAEIALKNITGGVMGFKEAAILTGPALQKAEDDIKNISAAMGDARNGVLGWDIVQTEFNFKLDQAKAAIDAFMIALGTQLLPLLSPLVSGFTSFVTTLTGWIQHLNMAGSSGNLFITILTSIGVSGKTAQQIFDDLSLTFHLLGTILGDVGSFLTTLFGGALQSVGNLIKNFANGPLDGIIKGFNLALSSVTGFTNQLGQVASVIESILGGLAPSAFIWGQNMMAGFENGVISVINDIITVVEQVAQELANYLGFSSPTKKGPGSTLGQWGQGMMIGLAQGITQNLPVVTDAVLTVADQLSTLGSPDMALSMVPDMSMMVDKLTGDSRQVTVTPDAQALKGTRTAQSHPAAVQHLAKGSGASSPATQHLTSGLASSLVAGAGTVKAAANTVGQQLHAVCKQHAQSTSTCAAQALTTGLATKLHAGKSAVAAAAHAIGSGTSAAGKASTAEAAKAAKAAKAAAAAAKAQDAANARAATMHAEWQKAMQESSSAAVQALVEKSKAAFAKGHTSMAAFYAKEALALGAQQQAAAKKAQADAAKSAKAAAKLGPAPVAGVGPSQPQDILGGNTIAKSLEPVKKAATDTAKVVTQALGPAATFVKNAWSSLTGVFSQIGSTLQKVVQAMMPGLLSIGKVVQTQLFPAFRGLWTALAPLVSGIGQLVGAVVLSVAAFAQWITQGSTLKAIWDGLVVGVKGTIAVISTIASVIGQALAPIIKQLVTTFNTQLKPAWNGLTQTIQQNMPLLRMIGGIIATGLVVQLGIVIGLIAGLAKGFSALVQGAIKTFGGIVEVISGVFQVVGGVIAWFVDFFTGNWDKLKKDNDLIWNGILMTLKGVWDMIVGVFTSSFGFLWGLVSGFVQGIITFFTNLYNALIGHSIIPDIINGIIRWFTTLVTDATTLVSHIVAWITDHFTQLKDNALATWKTLYDGVSSSVSQIQATVQKIITTILTWISSQWNSLLANTKKSWNTVITIISGILTNLSNTIKSWFTTASTNMGTWAGNMMQMFGTAIKNGFHWITDPLNTLGSNIAKLFGFNSPPALGPLAASGTWMPNMMHMFGQGIQQNTLKVTTPITNVAQSINTQFSQLGKQVTNSTTIINTSVIQMGTTVNTTANEVTPAVTMMSNQVKASSDSIGSSMGNTTIIFQTTSQQAQQSSATIGFSVTTASTAVQTAGGQVSGACQSMGQSFSTLKVTFSKSNDEIRGSSNEMLANLLQGYQKIDQANQTFAQGFSEMVHGEFQSGLSDMMSSFQQAAQGITQQANALAQGLSNVLGFHSPPKQGPLSDSDQWMPNMVKMMATGLQQNTPLLIGAATQVAGKLSSAHMAIASAVGGKNAPNILQEGLMGGDDLLGKHVVENLVMGIRAGTPLLSAEVNRIESSLKTAFAPPSQNVFALSQSSPNGQYKQDIHIYLDGKPIMKKLGEYIGKEVRVQGNVRGI